MSEIPYYFETPIPKYFREAGWFDSPNSILFITWAFSKCSSHKRTVVHDSKEITLEPFEFITGRGKSAADSMLSVEAFRHQLKLFLNANLLKKTPNSVTNRYTCYVWATERFSKDNPQLNPKLNTNCAPTEPPQSRRKNIRTKKDHHPYPSSSKVVALDRDDGVMIDDDLLSSSKKYVTEQAQIGNAAEIAKVEVIPGVFLTQEDLDKCIKIKGSFEEVQLAIQHVKNSPRRKYDISDWVHTLSTWKIKSKPSQHAEKNKAWSKKICEACDKKGGYPRCREYHDKNKDQLGILFEAEIGRPDFVAYVDPEFDEKCRVAGARRKMW